MLKSYPLNFKSLKPNWMTTERKIDCSICKKDASMIPPKKPIYSIRNSPKPMRTFKAYRDSVRISLKNKKPSQRKTPDYL